MKRIIKLDCENENDESAINGAVFAKIRHDPTIDCSGSNEKMKARALAEICRDYLDSLRAQGREAQS